LVLFNTSIAKIPVGFAKGFTNLVEFFFVQALTLKVGKSALRFPSINLKFLMIASEGGKVSFAPRSLAGDDNLTE
jgi:hypothetical protein